MARSGVGSLPMSTEPRMGETQGVQPRANEAPKTKLLATKLKEMGLADVLIVVEAFDEKLELASRNLNGVTVLPVTAVDPVSLIRHERVLATVGAVRMLEEKLA